MIEVYGYLGAPDEEVRRAVAAAGRVVAGTRALDGLGVPAPRRIVLGGVSAAIEALTAYQQAGSPDGPAVVLASGDPLLYGVVRRFRAGGLRVRVRPGVSSIAAAFAAVGLPWDDAQIVSAHGHGMAPTWAACRALRKVAVLTGPGHGVQQIAGALADLTRWYVVAERLGESDERVRILDGATAREITDVAEPNVVLVLADEPGSPDALGRVGPFAGGTGHPAARPARPAPEADGGDLAVHLVLGRHAPVLGDTVWTGGDVAEAVAGWCAATGAAVVDLDRLPHGGPVGAVGPVVPGDEDGPGGRNGPTEHGGRAIPASLPDPGLVILHDPAWLPALAARRARHIVLVCGEDAAERVADAVDGAGFGEASAHRVDVEHFTLTAADGGTLTCYVTTITTTTERPGEDA